MLGGKLNKDVTLNIPKSPLWIRSPTDCFGRPPPPPADSPSYQCKNNMSSIPLPPIPVPEVYSKVWCGGPRPQEGCRGTPVQRCAAHSPSIMGLSVAPAGAQMCSGTFSLPFLFFLCRVAGSELPLGRSPTAGTTGNACLISTSGLFPCWLT